MIAKLTKESMQEITSGMRRVTVFAVALDAWQDKLKTLGVDVDGELFGQVQHGLLQLHGDIMQEVETSLAEMHKQRTKPAQKAGFTCVPGIH